MSDARRQKATGLWEAIGQLNPNQGVQCLNFVVEGVRLLQEEGYLADADDFTNEAGPVCAYHSDWVSTSYWAALTYHTRVAEFGEDSPRAAEVRKLHLNAKSFAFAGLGPRKDLSRFRV